MLKTCLLSQSYEKVYTPSNVFNDVLFLQNVWLFFYNFPDLTFTNDTLVFLCLNQNFNDVIEASGKKKKNLLISIQEHHQVGLINLPFVQRWSIYGWCIWYLLCMLSQLLNVLSHFKDVTFDQKCLTASNSIL